MFAAKLPREITHERGLRDCEAEINAFVASMSRLHAKLACVLVQLPPWFSIQRDERVLRDFVRHLPAGVRFAIEFRDAEWHLPRIMHLLEEHRVCWAWNDTTPIEHADGAAFGFWPLTTDFLYIRLLGDPGTNYDASGGRVHSYRSLRWPRDSALEHWAVKVRAVAPKAKRVLIYANNHYEGFSPQTAARIADKLGVLVSLPTPGELGDDTQQMPLL